MAKMKIIPRISSVELPWGWTDESTYEFASRDESVDLTIVPQEAEADQSMDGLLTDVQERYESLGLLEVLEKRELRIDGQQAGLLKTAVDPEDGDAFLAYALVVRFAPNEVLGAFMNGPKDKQREVEQAWSVFIENLKFEGPDKPEPVVEVHRV